MKRDISIVILAFNEEKNIEAAIRDVDSVLKRCTDDYEILVVNDGSSDETGVLAEKQARANEHIRVIHNDKNRGIGYSYRRGVSEASKTYVAGFPGDNDMSASSLENLIREIGGADIITSYMADAQQRSPLRRFLSRGFVFLMNGIFGLHLKYYNGSRIIRTDMLKNLQLKTDGFAMFSEMLVRLIHSGCSYKEVKFEHTGRSVGRSTSLRWGQIIASLKIIAILIWDIYIDPVFTKKAKQT